MTPAIGAQVGSRSNPEDRERRLSLRLHTEDIVCDPENPSVIGVVTRVHNDEEFEEDEDEYEEDDAPLEPGQVEVCWIGQPESASDSNHEEPDNQEIVDSSKLTLVDRSLMHGDIVGVSANPLGQSGTVVDVDLSVDLKLSNGTLIQDVSAKRLGQIRKFSVGCYVMYQQWLGKIEEVLDDLVICFEDGGVCEVKDVAYPVVVPVALSAADDENMCPYWPGQVVRAYNPGSTFRTAKWLQGSWSPNKQTGTVKEVKPGSITITWRTCVKMPSGNGDLLNPPTDVIAGSALTPLTYFAYTHFQLGDRCLVPQDLLAEGAEASPADGPADESEGAGKAPDTASPASSSPPSGAASSSGTPGAGPGQETDHGPAAEGKGRKRAQKRAQQRERRRAKNQKGPAAKEKVKLQAAAVIVNTRTTVAVLWQDGSKAEGLRGADLFPVEDLGDYDFWPEEYVVEREPSEEGKERQCLVKAVNAKERTAVVKWLEGELEYEQPLRFGPEEVVSVYELAEHPDYDYRLGDVVTRLPGATRGTILNPSDEIPPTSDTSSSPAAPQLEYVGEIVALRDGLITVAWADGVVSRVGPQNVLVASSEDDGDEEVEDESFYGSDEEDAESWETLSGDGSEQEGPPPEDPANEVVQRWQQAEATFAALDGSAPRSMGTSRFGEEALWTADDFPALPAANLNGLAGPSGQPPNVEAIRPGIGSRYEPPPNPLSASPGALGLPGAGLRFLGRVARGWLMYGAEGVSVSQGAPSPDAAGTGAGGETAAEAEKTEDANAGRENEGGAAEARKSGAVELGAVASDEAPEPCLDAPPLSSAPRMEVEALATLSGSEASVPVEPSVDSAATATAGPDYQGGIEMSWPLTRPTQRTDETSVSAPGVPDPRLTEKQAAAVQAAGEKLRGLKHFELLPTAPEDHKFLDQTGQATNPRRWAKRIQTEWAALEASLPDSIYLQVYEGRMDLLRAVIVGAAGTPYHDNLFFFDFHFPPEYPNAPPLAHYHSGGLRVNPNLYESGKVCLSLLNTWNGKGTELWDATSSMLQVLISLQGLVLVPKPYFNEAGYEKQQGTIEGEKNSLVYNESAYLLVCKSMQYLIRRPPQYFEELVQCFYRRRAPALLGALAAYLKGKRVGSLPEWKEDAGSAPQTASTSESEGTTAGTVSYEESADPEEQIQRSLGDGGCSVGFRIVLGKMAPKLQTQLSELLEKSSDS